jgi:ATP-binding cassette, subfamily B, bacterial
MGLERSVRVPTILQMTSHECAAACLAMVLGHHGCRMTLSECREALPAGRDGTTAQALARAAKCFGLNVKVVSADLDAVGRLPLPAIVHWDFNHFVVVERISGRSARLVDPARGRVTVPLAEFDLSYTGVALVLQPTSAFQKHQPRRELRWRLYLRHLRAFRKSIALVAACSLVLQLAGLALPLIIAVAVDRLIPTAETDLLVLIAIGVALLALNQLVLTNLREGVLLYLKAHLDLRIARDFVGYLLSLPLSFFERRGSADLIGRLSSSAVVRDALSTQVIGVLVDGLFAATYLLALLSISPVFALAAVLVAGVNALVVWALSVRLDVLLRTELSARAESYDYLAQALIGIATLKASGGEHRALEHWSPLLGNEIRATVAANRVTAVITVVSGATRFAGPLILLLLGTYLASTGAMTVGVMFAAIALATAFVSPVGSLVMAAQEIRRAGAHLDRIADVLNATAEEPPGTELRPRRRLSGRIDLQDVDFAYESGALVLRGISIRIGAGDKVAIVGRSGSGKSTLAKLLLGLYRPVKGEISFDGLPLHEYCLPELRGQFGVVLQEPALFGGTIRQNISFHSPEMSLEQVVRVAKLAGIHDEIGPMPLGYDTPILHAGGGVSGGQRQRIALAQALAHDPVILVLDEATSHLDAVTEQEIEARLSLLDCTRIVIAHRLSTVRDADQIVVLDRGAIVEQGTHESLLKHRGHYSALVRRQGQYERAGEPPALVTTGGCSDVALPTNRVS